MFDVAGQHRIGERLNAASDFTEGAIEGEKYGNPGAQKVERFREKVD